MRKSDITFITNKSTPVLPINTKMFVRGQAVEIIECCFKNNVVEYFATIKCNKCKRTCTHGFDKLWGLFKASKMPFPTKVRKYGKPTKVTPLVTRIDAKGKFFCYGPVNRKLEELYCKELEKFGRVMRRDLLKKYGSEINMAHEVIKEDDDSENSTEDNN